MTTGLGEALTRANVSLPRIVVSEAVQLLHACQKEHWGNRTCMGVLSFNTVFHRDCLVICEDSREEGQGLGQPDLGLISHF